MNYLREINAFRRKMERAPLSHTAQILWYVLMDFDNRLRWMEEFQVGNDRLEELLGGISKNTLISARKELVDAGLLTFTQGKKGTPSTYHLEPIVERWEFSANTDDQEAFLCEVKEDITTYFGYTATLGKDLKQTVEAIWKEFLPGVAPTDADAREVFYYIFHQEQTEDGEVVMTFPHEKKEMLAYAFEQARANRAINWKYIRGIYQNWARYELHTMQQIYDHEEERARRRNCS